MASPTSVVGRVALPLAVAAAVFWVAFDGGTYALVERSTLGIAVWWALGLGLLLRVWPTSPPPVRAFVIGGLLLALGALAGFSALWGDSAEKAFREWTRTSLYLGIFFLGVLAGRRRHLPGWIGGLALAIAGIALVALGGRLFPDIFGRPAEIAQLFTAAERRLSYPINYWNGLATFFALGAPLLLHLATWARLLVVRAAAVGVLPLFAAAIYLTSSRGASIAGVAAILLFITLTSRRWQAAGAVAIAAAGSAAAVAILLARPDLVNEPFVSGAAVREGPTVAFLLALTASITAIVFAGAAKLTPVPPPVPRTLARGLVVAAIAVLAIGAAAADPAHRFEQFKRVPPGLETATIEEHFVMGTGSGRWQLWEAAADQFAEHPVLGDGAGSYEAWWAEHSTLGMFVRDAHSLYLEVASELGVIGLALVIAFVASVGVAAVMALRGSVGEHRSAVASLVCLALVFLLEAGVDWMWELTAVSVPAMLAFGLLCSPAAAPSSVSPRRLERLNPVALGGALVLVVIVLVSQAIPLATTLELRQSQTAAELGDTSSALEHAAAAERIEPWAATPHLQQALVYELSGDFEAAVAEIEQAIDRDESDWRLWLTAARLQTRAGLPQAARDSLAEAARLNPHSGLFAAL